MGQSNTQPALEMGRKSVPRIRYMSCKRQYILMNESHTVNVGDPIQYIMVFCRNVINSFVYSHVLVLL